MAFYVESHPVIYKDGWVFWTRLSTNSNVSRVSYSFDPSFSVELNSSFYRMLSDYRDYSFGLNHLVKRWIFNDSQANLYLMAHAGYFEQKPLKKNGFVAHGSLMGDWESQEFYTAATAELYHFKNQSLPKFHYRLGFAPYDAGMDALQSWFIVQLSYFPEINKHVEITPMLRFFYKNVLWEFGGTLKGDFFLTLMTHI